MMSIILLGVGIYLFGVLVGAVAMHAHWQTTLHKVSLDIEKRIGKRKQIDELYGRDSE